VVDKKFRTVPDYGHIPYSQNPIGLYRSSIQIVLLCALTRFPAIFDWTFGCSLRTPKIYGKGAYGVRDGTVQKSVGDFL